MSTLVTIRRPGSSTTYPLAKDGTAFSEPSGNEEQQLETSELWALPGLADAHAHLTMQKPTDIHGITDEQTRSNIPAMAWAQVDRGVLLILDKGGASDVTLLTREPVGPSGRLPPHRVDRPHWTPECP